jgi:lysophospholipase L1-like esterase
VLDATTPGPGERVPWGSFVALGDSFTEGIDDLLPDGAYRGWADVLAMVLADRRPGLRYANLAVRGRLLPQIVAEQVPRARRLQPDLVSLVGGVNDLLRPSFDPPAARRTLERGVAALRADDIDVILVVGVNPTVRSRVLTRLMPRIVALNEAVAEVAQRYECRTVDLHAAPVFDDERLWSADRLHLSALGHERVAGAFLEALGLGDDRWREPLPPVDLAQWWQQRGSDVDWARTHLLPWLGRRLRGTSSGAGVLPKRPQLTPVVSE